LVESWSFVLNASRFSAAALSAAAAAVLQLKSIPWSEATRADVGAILAAVATLIVVFSAVGGFERKWRANRVMKGSLTELNIQMTDPSCDLGAVRKQLIEISRLRNLEITGLNQQLSHALRCLVIFDSLGEVRLSDIAITRRREQ